MEFLKTVETYFLWLMIYSIIGWIYESTLCSITNKKLINRGFLNGPYCPIYGSGAILVILILGRIKNPVLLFFLGALVTCSLEYLTSYVMEKLFHARWWDYSQRKFNINGRVCLIGAVVFGAFSVALNLGLHPLVKGLTDKLSPLALHITCGVLFVIFATDCIVTIKGFAGFREKLEELSEFIDRQKEAAVDRLHSSEVYISWQERKNAIKKKLNPQQRRMLYAFPSLKMRKPNYNELLSKLRNFMKKNTKDGK